MPPGAPDDARAGAPDEGPVNARRPPPSKGRNPAEARSGGPDAAAAPSDAELVDRAKSGDPHAFRALFDRHHARLFAMALGVVKNRQDALDVVQDAFVKVHRHIDRFEGTSSFYTWLYRIGMNLAIDLVRKNKRARTMEYDDAVARDEEALEAPSLAPRLPHTNPGKRALDRELGQAIADALDTLPEHHRAVILLREVEGLTYEEMAEVLDVPKGTIMSRLFHARRKMQAALTGYLGEAGGLDGAGPAEEEETP